MGMVHGDLSLGMFPSRLTPFNKVLLSIWISSFNNLMNEHRSVPTSEKKKKKTWPEKSWSEKSPETLFLISFFINVDVDGASLYCKQHIL